MPTRFRPLAPDREARGGRRPPTFVAGAGRTDRVEPAGPCGVSATRAETGSEHALPRARGTWWRGLFWRRGAASVLFRSKEPLPIATPHRAFWGLGSPRLIGNWLYSVNPDGDVLGNFCGSRGRGATGFPGEEASGCSGLVVGAEAELLREQVDRTPGQLSAVSSQLSPAQHLRLRSCSRLTRE